MSTVERFEDLIAWQKARVLTRRIYQITRDGALSRDYGLTNQMQRAAVSVMSNIAEGFERKGYIEFCRFLNIAKASCAELRSQLYIALDADYLEGSQFNELKAQAEEVSRVISGLYASVEKQKYAQKNRQ